jgi:hypothetical protein
MCILAEVNNANGKKFYSNLVTLIITKFKMGTSVTHHRSIASFFFFEEDFFIDYRNSLARLQGARAGLPQRLTVSSDAEYTR